MIENRRSTDGHGRGSVSAERSRGTHQVTLVYIAASKMASLGHVGTGLHSSLPVIHIDFRKIAVFTLVLLKLGSNVADDTFSQEPVYFDQLYVEGVKAYTDQLWYKCAYNLENAVKEYRNYKKALTDCRMTCKRKERRSPLEELSIGIGDLSMFESFLKHADCYRRCKSDAYELRPGFRLTNLLEAAFETRQPYQYLQFCWYKVSCSLIQLILCMIGPTRQLPDPDTVIVVISDA